MDRKIGVDQSLKALSLCLHVSKEYLLLLCHKRQKSVPDQNWYGPNLEIGKKWYGPKNGMDRKFCQFCRPIHDIQ